MTSPARLLVNDVFTSIQGEGPFAGAPMTFLRLQGCNLKCPWCDTKASWGQHRGLWQTVSQVAENLLDLPPTIVCVTGGEPMLQQESLAKLMKKVGPLRRFHLETNGTIPREQDLPFEYVVVSPKPPIYEIALLPDVVKLVVTDRDCLAWARALCAAVDCHVILQPVDNRAQIARMCVDWIVEHAERYGDKVRLSMQLHKLLNIK